ncbi:protein Hook homolog 3-like isoform X3 [Convolutriloba macropyga]|uniref:protein Hook homolog 3-like isoform X3 n=1 Tax=Convolutriloba macropyga TaxID=536237 RepID=UPI003F51E478
MSELDSLVKWLSTLGLESVDVSLNRCDNNPSVLSDGILLADCLSQIAPSHFDSDFTAKIRREDLVDYRLKANNLKKIVQFIISYYQEVLFQDLSDEVLPDETRIAADCDGEETSKMLRLVLGCAINCDQKEQYISGIMALEESIQQDVMSAIQKLMSSTAHQKSPGKPGATSPFTNGGFGLGGFEDELEQQHIIDRQLKEAWDEVHRLTMENEELSQKYHDIQQKMDYMSEEKDYLIGQMEAAGIQHRGSRSSTATIGGSTGAENEANISTSSATAISPNTTEDQPPIAAMSSMKYKKLQEQYDELTHENYRLEAMKDDLRGRCEEQEQEIMELQDKVSEMSDLAKHARQYKDEVDELRSEITKTAKLESQVETMKCKLEEMGDLKRQMKMLEEKNLSYMQNNLQLEEETKKLTTLRQQVENYRLQMQKLESELMRESKRADRAQFDLDKKAEKVANLEAEIEKSRQEQQRLREEMDDMSLHQSTKPANHKADVTADKSENNSAENSLASLDSPRGANSLEGNANSLTGEEFLSPQIKEKITRLTAENRVLKRSLGSNPEAAEQLQLVKGELEDEQRRRADLESENRLSNGKIMELESRVEELQSQLNSSHSASDSSSLQLTEMRKKLHEYMDKAREMESGSRKVELQRDSLEAKLKETEDKLRANKDLLSKKENDMKLMEDRYKKYLEKAKNVVKVLDPRTQAGVTPEIQSLKNQLTDKEKMIQQLEKERDKSRVVRDQEERLVVSAWYNLGMQLQRHSADNRLASSASSLPGHQGGSGGRTTHQGSSASSSSNQSFLNKHRGRSAVHNASSQHSGSNNTGGGGAHHNSGRPPLMSYVSANSAPMTHGSVNNFQTNSSYVTEQQWIQAQQLLPGSNPDAPRDSASRNFPNHQPEQFLNPAELAHQLAQHQQQQQSGANHQPGSSVDPSIYPQFYMQFEGNQGGAGGGGGGGYDTSRPSSVPYPAWSGDNAINLGSSYAYHANIFELSQKY